MRSTLLRVFTTAAILAAVACSVDKVSSPAPTIEETTFASSLGVELGAMTRTTSGLYMQDVTVGDGQAAAVGDSIVAHYTLRLPDGTLLQTNVGGTAFRALLGHGRLIAGWDEGLVGMKEGGERRLIVPPALGYGSSGSGNVPPNAILVFDVALQTVIKD